MAAMEKAWKARVLYMSTSYPVFSLSILSRPHWWADGLAPHVFEARICLFAHPGAVSLETLARTHWKCIYHNLSTQSGWQPRLTATEMNGINKGRCLICWGRDPVWKSLCSDGLMHNPGKPPFWICAKLRKSNGMLAGDRDPSITLWCQVLALSSLSFFFC